MFQAMVAAQILSVALVASPVASGERQARVYVRVEGTSVYVFGDRITYQAYDLSECTTATATSRRNWSLLALIAGHAAAATDFENPLAPMANTIRLSFGNAPVSGAVAPTGLSGTGLPDTVAFVSFDIQAPAAKEVPAKEGAARNAVVVSAFPAHAPAIGPL